MKKNETLYFEVHLLGYIPHNDKKDMLKKTLNNLFDKSLPTEYTITTYENKQVEGIGTKKNLIEVHLNNKFYPNDPNIDIEKIFKINHEEFYTKLNPFDNFIDYLKYSQCFIKYIAQNKINSKIGTTKVVDYCRCEDNIIDMLKSIGYSEKSRIKKSFGVYKYKYGGNVYFQASTLIDEIHNITTITYELFGFCKSTEEEKLVSKMTLLKEEFEKYMVFA